MNCLLCLLYNKGIIDLPTCLCIYMAHESQTGETIDKLKKLKKRVDEMSNPEVKPESRIMDSSGSPV